VTALRESGPRTGPGAVEWVTLALICASSALSALLELLFLGQFYVGSIIVPLVIVAAIAGNLALPRWGMSVIGAGKGAVLPMLCWLIVLLVPSLYNRPEGDLFVIASYGQEYAFYGLLLGGSLAGFATIVTRTVRL
jgi:hypothetical protein